MGLEWEDAPGGSNALIAYVSGGNYHIAKPFSGAPCWHLSFNRRKIGQNADKAALQKLAAVFERERGKAQA